MLIAYLTAHLVNGNTFELLPVQHETDVKKEVSALLEGWSSSGFLIWEKFVYPWHQVQLLRCASRMFRVQMPDNACWVCAELTGLDCMMSSGRVAGSRQA